MKNQSNMRFILRCILLLIIVHSYNTNYAQHSTGLILDNDAYNKVPHLPEFGGAKYNDVPISYTLRPYAPKIGNQGRIGSCTGWAAGYAALTISRAVKDDIKDQDKINSIAQSALYVYNNIKITDDCNSGAFLHEALEFLKESGDCLNDDFSSDNCNTIPTSEATKDFEFIRIKEYAAVYSILDSDKVKISKVKKSICADKPVIVGLNISNDFLGLRSEIWNQKEGQSNIGGHAMCIIGYDEVLRAFEVMNSWGEEWGDNGFVWIPYDVFTRNSLYGYQIILASSSDDDKIAEIEETSNDEKNRDIENVESDEGKDESKNLVKIIDEDDSDGVYTDREVDNDKPEAELETIKLSGSFDFKNLIGYQKSADNTILKNDEGEKLIHFENAPVEFQDSIYVLEDNKWKNGDLFQLVAANVPEGNYVYVGSFDPDNQLNVHWPKKAVNNIPVANYIPSQFAEVCIPGVNRVLRLEKAGTNVLLVLYSHRPIEDFEEKFTAIRDNEELGFYSKVDSVFGKNLVDNSEITYEDNSMNFETNLEEDGPFIVPIILEVNSIND